MSGDRLVNFPLVKMGMYSLMQNLPVLTPSLPVLRQFFHCSPCFSYRPENKNLASKNARRSLLFQKNKKYDFQK